MKKRSVCRRLFLRFCAVACGLVLGAAQVLADDNFKYTVKSATAICDLPKKGPGTIDWRKFTEFLIAQNNLTSLYVRALETCRPANFTALAGRFATYGYGNDGDNVCAPGQAEPWKQGLQNQDDKNLRAFARSFVNLLVRLETRNPQPVGNGVFLEIKDMPAPQPGAASTPSARAEKAVSDYRAEMASAKPSQGVLQSACYRPSGVRETLEKIVSGEARLPAKQDQAASSQPKAPDAGVPPGAPPKVSQDQHAAAGGGGAKPGWDPYLSFRNFRLRGAPAQLAEVPTSSADGGDDQALSEVNAELYVPGNQAKLSFQQNSGSNAVTNNVVGALGYNFTYRSQPWTAGITPYVATDREIKYANNQNKTQPNVSANTLDFGFVLSGVWDRNPPSPTAPDLEFNRLYLLVRPDWLKNFVDHSEIWSINTRLVPLVTGPVPFNSLRPIWLGPVPSDTYRWTPLLDLRFDKGWFTARGRVKENLPLNEDFTRLGGMVGLALEANWIPGQPVDLFAQYIDFVPIQGFKKSLGYFQTQGTWYIADQKAVGITASYENGRRQDTAQRYEAWTISLTFKL